MLKLPKRIDTLNAKEVEKELLTEAPDVLSADELEYISSLGLRVLLKLSGSKKEKIRIIDVSPEVYEIFEVTGFTEILDVTRKYRSVDVSGLKMIGQGSNGKVYRMDPETIIKVYDADRHYMDASKAREEAEISRKVFLSGVPTAISYDIVRCGDYYAAIYESIQGVTMGEALMEDSSRLEELIGKLAEIGRELHSKEADPESFDSTLERFKEDGKYLDTCFASAEDSNKWKSLMDCIPERHTMVHTDFHYDNVMLRDGEPVLIDVGGVKSGHPVFDLMTMYLRAAHHELSPTRFDAATEKEIFEVYIKAYFKDSLNEVSQKALMDILEWMGTNVLMVVGIKKGVFKKNDEKMKAMLDKMLSVILKEEPEALKEKFALVDRYLF